ncbi:MAG: hypothetical protein IKH06_01885 [Clostridiales bacterium]|nr:hypothetical protein [Clostridiales bacterium]
MKNFRSIAALGLVLAMGASFAGCSSNEGGAPSDTTAPVVTESVTDAVLTDGSEDDTVIEGSGVSEKPAGDVFEVMASSLKLAMGQDKDTVKAAIESLFGAKLGNEEVNKNDYFYSTDITIEGLQFTHVTIRTDGSDGKVSNVELMNDTSNTDECKGFVETFKNKLTALYGDKVAPSDSSEFEGFTVSYGDGLSCSVGGSYSANYNKFCLSFNGDSA